MGKHGLYVGLLFFSTAISLFAQLVPLDIWVATSRLDFEYFPSYQEFLLKKKKGQSARFGILSDYTWLENQGFEQTGPLIKEGDKYFLSPKLYKTLRCYFEQTDACVVKPKVTTIVLDAGHGGRDLGAVASYKKEGKKIDVLEKNIALAVVKKIAEKIKDSSLEVEIVLTRDKDIFLTLEQRVTIANERKPEFPHELIFISVHANFSPYNKKAQGFEVWSLPDKIEREVAPLLDENFKQNWKILNSFLNLRYKKESRRLADCILEAYTKRFSQQTNRGIKQESWFVVKNTHMPAVLIEVGFISSEEEALLLNDPKHLDALAEVISTGIKRFIDEYT